jgi:hypothetical protein
MLKFLLIRYSHRGNEQSPLRFVWYCFRTNVQITYDVREKIICSCHESPYLQSEYFDYYLTFNYKQYLQIRRQVIVHTAKKIAA